MKLQFGIELNSEFKCALSLWLYQPHILAKCVSEVQY